MQKAKARLAVASILFAAWIFWLAYLSIVTVNQTVFSRPQLLVADAHVVAQLDEGADSAPDSKVTIKRVVWAAPKAKRLEEGAEIKIIDLDFFAPEQGWKGSGEYILPLTETSQGYIVTATPSSPGYAPESKLDIAADEAFQQTKAYLARARIYPADKRALQQLKELEVEFNQN